MCCSVIVALVGVLYIGLPCVSYYVSWQKVSTVQYKSAMNLIYLGQLPSPLAEG